MVLSGLYWCYFFSMILSILYWLCSPVCCWFYGGRESRLLLQLSVNRQARKVSKTVKTDCKRASAVIFPSHHLQEFPCFLFWLTLTLLFLISSLVHFFHLLQPFLGDMIYIFPLCHIWSLFELIYGQADFITLCVYVNLKMVLSHIYKEWPKLDTWTSLTLHPTTQQQGEGCCHGYLCLPLISLHDKVVHCGYLMLQPDSR